MLRSKLCICCGVVMDFDFWYYAVHVTQIEQDQDSQYTLVRQNKLFQDSCVF